MPLNTFNNTVSFFDIAAGKLPGSLAINKFGEAPSGIQTTLTDIWSRADATPTQQIWLAPTSAKVHALVSSSDSDGKTGAPASVGARTIRIYGLKTWDTAESSEDVTLDGTTPVNTANSYVIIHRMKVLTSGTSGPNVGTITATAADLGTVTATIIATDGQTEMAIYGVPSTKDAYCPGWYAGIDKSSGLVVSVDYHLLVNEAPNVNPIVFLRKDDITLQSNGTSMFQKQFIIPAKFSGPCIIKVGATASSADTDGVAGFDLVMVDK